MKWLSELGGCADSKEFAPKPLLVKQGKSRRLNQIQKLEQKECWLVQRSPFFPI